MHAVMRSYSGKGAKELFDVIEKNKAEVEKVIRPVKGFVSYSVARTADGGFSVTVCQDKAGCESTRAARDWIAKNAFARSTAFAATIAGTARRFAPPPGHMVQTVAKSPFIGQIRIATA